MRHTPRRNIDYVDFQAYYMKKIICHPDDLFANAERMLARMDFDTMVGTGLSGSLVIPELARRMGKFWFLVRKSSESSHSRMIGEGRLGHKWLFVDDLICSGATFLRVERAVKTVCETIEDINEKPWPIEFVGSYLFGEYKDSADNYLDAQSTYHRVR